MSAEKEHVDRRVDMEGDCREVAESDLVRATSPHILLQQLHQVQEELEQYYLKCLNLDSDLQVARLAGDDAKREIQALRLQLQHLQRELVETGASGQARSVTRRALSRLIPSGFRRHGRAGEQQRELTAQLAAIRASEWFDASWYLATYADVREAGMDPVEHYHEFGWKEARNPGPRFDTAWYLHANPDVAAAGISPLWHFIEHGSKEGRPPLPT